MGTKPAKFHGDGSVSVQLEMPKDLVEKVRIWAYRRGGNLHGVGLERLVLAALSEAFKGKLFSCGYTPNAQEDDGEVD